MSIVNCKMCGGKLVLTPGSTVAECEYCGTIQTVPSADNEKKMTLFNRANRLRFGCEFDKAAGIYEAIVADFPEEAEAYWGLVLCKYGIEYVDDPATAKKIPTCHRSSFDSVMDDGNFEQALENADASARKVYRAEAKQIEEIRKGIIEVSSKEDPYDIFICYKETDENGERTLDSVLAQDIYDALTEKGYRTFFARITLEDKLGQEYEPYIFAALNSAKIMLAVGTDYEYYNAVWVKNEWSRFLHLISSGQKKTLIPCYKNIDAYDMPKEFIRLQGQDLGKVGAIQDLLRGIEKILQVSATSAYEYKVADSAVRAIEKEKEIKKIENAVYLGCMALDSQDTGKAITHFEEALNIDAECIGAYLGLVRAITDRKKIAPYIKKIKAMSIPDIIQYLKSHYYLIGDTSRANNLLTVAVNPIYSEALVLALLLELGVDGNAHKALMFSVEAFDSSTLTKVFILKGANVNATNSWSYSYKNKGEKYGYTEIEKHSVLSMAVRNRRSMDTIEALINAGANVNFVVDILEGAGTVKKRSITILNQAMSHRNYELVKLLLEKGVNPNGKRIVYDTKDEYGYYYSHNEKQYSMISDAIWNHKDIKLLEILLEHGANPNARDERFSGNRKFNALADAILYSDDTEMIKLLLKYGANPKGYYYYRDNLHEAQAPLLDLAVEKCRRDVISLLIDAGTSFSEQVFYKERDKEDRFPLSECAYVDKVLTKVGDLIRQYGWRGSKDGWFKKAHYCWYQW